jgi:transcriptional regulator with GAF, ATPase, and Fis domain
LVVGQAAVDVTPSETWVPAAMPFEVGEGVRSFRLREIERLLEASEGVGQMFVQPPMGWLRVSEFEEAFRIAELVKLAAALLPGGRQYAFVPVLEDERRALLGLVYRRADGSAGMMLGKQEPADFLAGLTKAVLAAQPNAAEPYAEGARKSQAPPSRTVVARLGAVETRSAVFGRAVSQLETVAAGDLGILFLGESGTGKEHLARAVHAASPRAKERFVGVNCGALPDGLIASELFGTRRGAFSGGVDRDGAFVSADGGTLFLDEIGDAPLAVQVALLRVLETRRVTPLGSNVETPVDVRVFAATSRDLESLMREGKFREDLYYRLAELSVTVPPLRERREDIPALARTVLGSFAEGVTLSSQAEALLLQNEWRGNVRELKNALRRAVALARGTSVLQVIHLAPGEDDAHVADAVVPDAALAFPPHVVERADAMWRGAEPLSDDEDASKYEQRARERAALLCLSARAPVTTWPKALAAHWHRLFRATWATSEDGRGLRELARELGMDARDEGVREAIRRRARD